MKNWKPGIKARAVSNIRGTLLRLIIALANSLNVDPVLLAKNMVSKSSKEYAKKLRDELKEQTREEYQKAVSQLTETL